MFEDIYLEIFLGSLVLRISKSHYLMPTVWASFVHNINIIIIIIINNNNNKNNNNNNQVAFFFRIEVWESCLLKGCLIITQICGKVTWKSLMWDLSGWGTALHDSQALREGDQLKLGFLMMDVSKNSGFSPQIIHFNRVFHYKPSILGYH